MEDDADDDGGDGDGWRCWMVGWKLNSHVQLFEFDGRGSGWVVGVGKGQDCISESQNFFLFFYFPFLFGRLLSCRGSRS